MKLFIYLFHSTYSRFAYPIVYHLLFPVRISISVSLVKFHAFWLFEHGLRPWAKIPLPPKKVLETKSLEFTCRKCEIWKKKQEIEIYTGKSKWYWKTKREREICSRPPHTSELTQVRARPQNIIFIINWTKRHKMHSSLHQQTLRPDIVFFFFSPFKLHIISWIPNLNVIILETAIGIMSLALSFSEVWSL